MFLQSLHCLVLAISHWSIATSFFIRGATMAVHPLAVVDPSAEIHETATVGPFSVVGPNVTLGPNVELKNHATVYGRSSIGEGSTIFPGAVVGSDPQDLKFKGEDSEVVVGKGCRIHECVTISKGTSGGGMQTVIGDNNLIMAYAHIAHDVRTAEHVVLGNSAQLAGHVIVNRNVVVSGMVGVHHFVTIGELAFVGGMSGVRQDVPPFVMAEGMPCEARGINLVGLRRAGWNKDFISATKDVFRRLFRRSDGTPVARVLEELEGSEESKIEPVARLINWMKQSIDTSMKGRALEASR
jgi:UDP-N-acetylglucosamine acyltransferase